MLDGSFINQSDRWKLELNHDIVRSAFGKVGESGQRALYVATNAGGKLSVAATVVQVPLGVQVLGRVPSVHTIRVINNSGRVLTFALKADAIPGPTKFRASPETGAVSVNGHATIAFTCTSQIVGPHEHKYVLELSDRTVTQSIDLLLSATVCDVSVAIGIQGSLTTPIVDFGVIVSKDLSRRSVTVWNPLPLPLKMKAVIVTISGRSGRFSFERAVDQSKAAVWLIRPYSSDIIELTFSGTHTSMDKCESDLLLYFGPSQRRVVRLVAETASPEVDVIYQGAVVTGTQLMLPRAQVGQTSWETLTLVNKTRVRFTCVIESSVPTLSITPGQVELGPSEQAIIQVAITGAAPEGERVGSLSISYDTGMFRIVSASGTLKKFVTYWTVGRPFPTCQDVDVFVEVDNVRCTIDGSSPHLHRLHDELTTLVRVENFSAVMNLTVLRITCPDPRVVCKLVNVDIYPRRYSTIPILLQLNDFTDWSSVLNVHTNCVEKPIVVVPLRLTCKKTAFVCSPVVPIPSLGMIRHGGQVKALFQLGMKSCHGWIENSPGAQARDKLFYLYIYLKARLLLRTRSFLSVFTG